LLERCPDVEPQRFRDGEYLVREGEVSSDVYLLVRGGCVIEQANPDRPEQRCNALAVVTGHLDAPTFVGEVAHLDGGTRTASVRSSMTTYALRLHPEHLDVIIVEFPELSQVLFQQFATRLKEAGAALKEVIDRQRMHIEQMFCAPGDVLIEAGQPAVRLFQLLDGSLIRHWDGQEHVLSRGNTVMGFVEPGPFFSGAAYLYTVTAQTSAVLLAFSEEDRVAIVRNFPDLLLTLYCEK
jgi:CRP-like cAMP-binding protein